VLEIRPAVYRCDREVLVSMVGPLFNFHMTYLTYISYMTLCVFSDPSYPLIPTFGLGSFVSSIPLPRCVHMAPSYPHSDQVRFRASSHLPPQ
jgi:hypothetical protein